jgi:hypothetical protein
MRPAVLFWTRLPRVQLVACIRLITIDFNPIRTSSYKKGASKVFKPGYIHPGERISPYQPEKSPPKALALELALAIGAGTHRSELFIAVDSRGVPIAESDLDRVVPYRRGSFRRRFGLEHRQDRRRRRSRPSPRKLTFLLALVIASSARTHVPQVREIVMTGVPVGPRNIHTGAVGHVNLHARGLLPRIDKDWHWAISASTACGFRYSSHPPESDFRVGMFWDDQGRCRCADPALG